MIYLKLEDRPLLADATEPVDWRQKRTESLFSDFASVGESYNLDWSPGEQTLGLQAESETTQLEGAPTLQAQVWYNQSAELIWVGGCPRSGTTLGRAMLDAHPAIRCGEETHMIPLILDFHAKHLSSSFMKNRLAEAKVTGEVLGDALGAYLLTIIWKHGSEAERLCNKDPMVLNHMEMVLDIFPNSLFVMMVRDGRAVCHSMITREVNILGFDTETYRGCLTNWNMLVERQHQKCLWVGPDRCRVQHYEDLVINAEPEMHELLSFLGVDWDEAVLHHTDKIGDSVSLSS